MNLASKAASVWKSAQLYIAYHTDKSGRPRSEPNLWSAKEAFAGLRFSPKDREAFVVVRGEDKADDMQVKFHPSHLIVRRERPLGWSGVLVGQDSVKVKVDGDLIEIGQDGTVKVTRDAETTYLEGDGTIIKVNPETEIMVSSDGSQMTRKTPEKFDAFTEDGFMSKKRTDKL